MVEVMRLVWPPGQNYRFTCLRCGKPVTLWWNGGELDNKQCSCGVGYSGQHVTTVIVAELPDEALEKQG